MSGVRNRYLEIGEGPLPWIIAGLAGLLLLGCEFGSESGSASRRLWRIPLHSQNPTVWKSDSVAFAMEGDSLLLYRYWNGCYRRVGSLTSTEFLGTANFTSEVVTGAGGDSLRMVYLLDSMEQTITFGEIRDACQSDAPIGKVGIKGNDLESGSFGEGDSLHVTLDYEYLPESGDTRTYYLGLNFYNAPGEYLAEGRESILTAPKGTVRLSFAAGDLPPEWKDAQSFGYAINLGFVRTSNQKDFLFTSPYRPVKATYRPVP